MQKVYKNLARRWILKFYRKYCFKCIASRWDSEDFEDEEDVFMETLLGINSKRKMIKVE